MQDFQNIIEKSARKVFRLFFGSRLYLRKNVNNFGNNLLGVDLLMRYNGEKRLSLYLENETMKSVIERLVGDKDIPSGEKVANDIIREMANMIAGYALKDSLEDVRISAPRRYRNINSANDLNALNFSSKLGKFAIAIEEI